MKFMKALFKSEIEYDYCNEYSSKCRIYTLIGHLDSE